MRAGALVEKVIEPLPGAGPSDEEALRPVLRWARDHHPGEIAEIYPGGRMLLGADAAHRWLALLRAWRAATGSAAVRSGPPGPEAAADPHQGEASERAQ